MDESLAQDFLAMWQSELTAMAADRELRESWAVFAALWAQSAKTALALLPHDPTPRSAGTAQPPWAAPAAAASQPRLDEVELLTRRVAELEQRLAEILGGGPGIAADRA